MKRQPRAPRIWLSCLLALACVVPSPASAARRALLIGIDDYSASSLARRGEPPPAVTPAVNAGGRAAWPDLAGAANDARQIREMLLARYGFAAADIRLLIDQQATRAAILEALDEHLLAPAARGDELVFFFAGHGSQVLNSKSDEPDGKDETLVPADSRLGARDVRDKELRRAFNAMLDRGARLTILLDSCHSGSGSRGLPGGGPPRGLALDRRDIADGTPAGPRPEERGALVLAAAQDFQLAWESRDEAGQPHGAFSLALLRALRAAGAGEPAERVFLRARAWMRLGNAPQEPVLAGGPEARQAPLFGGRADHRQGKTVIAAAGTGPSGEVLLQGGWANGLAPGCELRRLGPAESPPLALRVVSAEGLSRATAEVVQAVEAVKAVEMVAAVPPEPAAAISPGDLFELTGWASPPGRPLAVWIPDAGTKWEKILRLVAELEAGAAAAGVEWLRDPGERPTHTLTWWRNAWHLASPSAPPERLGPAPDPAALLARLPPPARLFLHLPAPPALPPRLRLGPGSEHSAVEPVAEPALADYALAGRRLPGGEIEYAWVRPAAAAPGVDSALPPRTDWHPLPAGPADPEPLAHRLEDAALRLAKIHAWLILESPPEGDFPYHLALTPEPGRPAPGATLRAGQRYGLALRAGPEALRGAVSPRYVYVFSLDSFGNSTLLFPAGAQGSVENFLPVPTSPPEPPPAALPRGPSPLFEIAPPFGTDTYFLLTSQEPIPNPWILEYQGVRRRAPPGATALEDLLSQTGSTQRGTKPLVTPTTWSLTRLTFTTTPPARGTPTPPAAPREPPPPEVEAFVAEFEDIRQTLSKETEQQENPTRDTLIGLQNLFERSHALCQSLENATFGDDLYLISGMTRDEWRIACGNVEILALAKKAVFHGILKDFRASLHYWKLALEAVRMLLEDPKNSPLAHPYSGTRTKDSIIFLRDVEIISLVMIGQLLRDQFGSPQAALRYSEQALERTYEIRRESGEQSHGRLLEAGILFDIGMTRQMLNEREGALVALEQALDIYRSFPDELQNQALVLDSLGMLYAASLDYGKAFEYFERSAEISEGIPGMYGRAGDLKQIGDAYRVLGMEEKAREKYDRALAALLTPENEEPAKKLPPALASAFANRDKALTLFAIGKIYLRLAQYQQAREYFEQALPLAAGEPTLVQMIHQGFGELYGEEKNWPKAVESYQQSLDLSRKHLPPRDVILDLLFLSEAYLELRNPRQAEQLLVEALILCESIGVDEQNVIFQNYSKLFSLLARTQEALGNRRLAIFYGKRAVNAIQAERGKFRDLEQELQRRFLLKNEDPYRRLADWLIAEGRLAEAEQVLAMLKEDEYFHFLRRDDKVARELLATIAPDDSERQAIARYEEIADQITTLGREYAELEVKLLGTAGLTEEEATRRREIKARLGDARKTFNRFLKELAKEFRKLAPDAQDRRLAELPSAQGLLDSLRQPRTVILSTIVGRDRLHLLVTAPKISRAHTVDIPAAEVNRRVAAFRQAVMNPAVDPRGAAKSLYDLLFPADLQTDLSNIDADTLVWSLDGTLRYAPIAALWDGERYLVEKYANAVISLASRNKLTAPSREPGDLTALGLGVSRAVRLRESSGFSVEFDALAAVPEELCSVVHDQRKEAVCAPLTSGQPGILEGLHLADEEFTLESFADNLALYPIVHIASHFVLKAGNEEDSFLLLGGGTDEDRRLTLAEVRDEIGPEFVGTELLTLSACDTAMSGGEKASGVEVESFGALAQNQGAKAIVATLWPVSDASTRDLMREFYRRFATGEPLAKAAALRRAQLALLRGEPGAPALSDRRGSRRLGDEPFARDERAPYAHPYFWSPFVLMGNWR